MERNDLKNRLEGVRDSITRADLEMREYLRSEQDPNKRIQRQNETWDSRERLYFKELRLRGEYER